VIWLLDTNMLVYARNGLASVVSRLDEAWVQGEVVTSLLVVGELIYGVEKSNRRDANLAAVDQRDRQLGALQGGERARSKTDQACRGRGQRYGSSKTCSERGSGHRATLRQGCW
jgi:predicted nucleic acid-binding protein